MLMNRSPSTTDEATVQRITGRLGGRMIFVMVERSPNKIEVLSVLDNQLDVFAPIVDGLTYSLNKSGMPQFTK